MSSGQKILIEPRNGSVEHYYHFLLGFCVPLLDYYLDHPTPVGESLIVRECGPLTKILRELALPLKIVPKSELTSGPQEPPPVRLCGLDSIPYFSATSFTRFRNHVLLKVRHKARKTKSSRILLIERGQPDPFYLSTDAEYKKSGAARRAIRNHAELTESLRARYPDLQNIQLENLPLYEQAALFHDADLVIAQHGAALGNMIFMRKGTAVIEIGSRPGALKLFVQLAATLKLKHQRLPLPGRYPTVRLEDLRPLMTACGF